MRNNTPATATAYDASAALTAIRAARAIYRHRRTWGRSRLLRYRTELVAMQQAGASLGEMAVWLRKKRIKVARSTISRFLATLEKAMPTTVGTRDA